MKGAQMELKMEGKTEGKTEVVMLERVTE